MQKEAPPRIWSALMYSRAVPETTKGIAVELEMGIFHWPTDIMRRRVMIITEAIWGYLLHLMSELTAHEFHFAYAGKKRNDNICKERLYDHCHNRWSDIYNNCNRLGGLLRNKERAKKARKTPTLPHVTARMSFNKLSTHKEAIIVNRRYTPANKVPSPIRLIDFETEVKRYAERHFECLSNEFKKHDPKLEAALANCAKHL
ncbi:unnamed protein product [Dibothriocephalus latus]|uniref:Uncharacterized protein n=1 Tax=Dibothriocephalus latus TaxID=60516 RepID=A0A3P7LZP2_DIBLA|nr:unnamed protein product [Dibothriocephalus latus]